MSSRDYYYRSRNRYSSRHHHSSRQRKCRYRNHHYRNRSRSRSRSRSRNRSRSYHNRSSESHRRYSRSRSRDRHYEAYKANNDEKSRTTTDNNTNKNENNSNEQTINQPSSKRVTSSNNNTNTNDNKVKQKTKQKIQYPQTSLNLKTLKSIDQRDKDLVFGYIKRSQKLVLAAHFIIPSMISYLCLGYYHIKWAWNTIKCGDNLEFVNDKTVKKINCNGHSICVFDREINDKMCDIFEITYLWRSSTDIDHALSWNPCRFRIGFLNASIESVKDFNKCLGKEWYQSSIEIIKDDWGGNSFEISHNHQTHFIGNHVNSGSLKGILFKLQFNFDFGRVNFYCNGEKVYALILNKLYNKIIPAISLYWKGSSVKVKKYDFKFNQY